MENEVENESSQRKDDHIFLARKSAIKAASMDDRFFYEPMLDKHPSDNNSKIQTTIFGKSLSAPLWVSSMTGGSERAHSLNRLLAKMVKKYGLGMGLGSCRCLIDSSDRFEDFNLRPILGDDVPFFANIGIAQLEELVSSVQKRNYFISQLRSLDVDGLIIHVNPLQEWLQPEGDRFTQSPLVTIERFIDLLPDLKLIIKEVGQGFGPRSMEEILKLPVAGIEFAAFGGTNFSRLEMIRGQKKHHQKGLSFIGHSVDDMIGFYNNFGPSDKEVILSGGVTNFLDGYYYQQKLNGNSVIGMAGEVLKYALEGTQALDDFMLQQIEGLEFSSRFLTVKQEKK